MDKDKIKFLSGGTNKETFLPSRSLKHFLTKRKVKKSYF